MEHQTLPSTSQRTPSLLLGLKSSTKTLPFASLPLPMSTSNTRIWAGLSGPSL
jgi:hypothetical protein